MGKPTINDHATEPLAEKQAAALLQFERLLQPLAELLVSQGLGYNQVQPQIKRAFMAAAKAEIANGGDKQTDAAISLLSGVHRKDVRASNEVLEPVQREKPAPSIASQVYTQWLVNAAYRGADGKPKPIPTAGPAPSFEALVASVSKDFHRRTVLDELIRLKLVCETENLVRPVALSVTPLGSERQLLEQLGANNLDHLQASVSNVRQAFAGEAPPHLEQAVFASGLSEESIKQLDALSRQLWKQHFEQLVNAATQLHNIDKTQASATRRMRVGMYFYSEDAPSGSSKKRS